MTGMWTMDELVERVGRALSAEYPGAPNGRIRDVPDRRAIRWYTTTGLVDRPAGMRGRTALYGPRHLLQLVALKRRQAQGHSLAAIQAELAGAADAELQLAARVPDELLTSDDAAGPADGPARPRFWAAAPAVAERPITRPAAATARPVGGVALGGGAILVLAVRPDAADYAAIATAARPLLDLLADRGLLTGENPEDGSPS
ncbi:MerR family transcriptional regulator [Actinoplanes sp. NPDC049118]|uniref:MerR family transcriptional regulator n=1 Tax=Actinoplanes sp. NPDC049118 TaxID=3155769 RepID=UPI0033D6933A